MIWTPEAERDREAIWAFVAAESPASAARMDMLSAGPPCGWPNFRDLGWMG